MKFTILGEPIAQKRPRLGKNAVYDPDYWQKVRVKKQMQKLDDIELEDIRHAPALSLSLTAYFLPQGDEKKNNAAYWGVIPCTNRKDLDNICKFYFDCANGILFKDDRLIVSVQIEKKHSLTPRVEIEIMPEEWEIHDYEGFYDLEVDRYSISELCEIASMIAEAEKESEGKGKVIAYLVDDFGIEGAKECLEENFIGCFDSPMDFIYNYIEDCGILHGVPEFIKSYFDYESYLRDLEINDVFRIDSKYNEVYYFHNR